MSVFLRLLAGPHIELETAVAASPSSPPQRFDLTPTNPVFLLVYLAVQADWVSRERLAALFWPDMQGGDARHNLRLTLGRARKLAWAGALEAGPHRLRLVVPSDVQAFRGAAARSDWAEAARLYRGTFLRGLPLGTSPGFSDWAEQERTALAHTWQDAVTRLAAQAEAASDHAQAAAWYGALLDGPDNSEDSGLSEQTLQAYLRCAYLAGQTGQALARFEVFRHTLHAEVGLEPLPATLELARTLRQAGPPGTLGRGAACPQIPLNVQRPPVLVGRDAALHAVAASEAAVVLVRGEPGIGKTRLLTEALAGARVLACREGLQTLSYAPLLDEVRARLDTLPQPYRAELARLLPELAAGGAGAQAEAGSADPELARVRMTEALALALDADPATPLIMDDLQWADAATLQVLALLTARGKRRLYGTYRDREVGAPLRSALEAWRSGRMLSEIHLHPLAEVDLTELLTRLSGQPEAPVLFGRWLRRASGGNPFFALETLKSLFETGRLRAEKGGWHTDHDDQTADYSELEVPQAIADVVARRVARLSSQAQRVVQAASVVGEDFGARLLGRITQLAEWDTQLALDEAEEAGILQGRRFGHDLSRQSVYGAMSPGRRALLHAHTAQNMELEAPEVGGVGSPEPLVIAGHWLASNEPPRAWPPMYRAALRALDRGDFSGAQGLLERVADGTAGSALQHSSLHFEASIRLGVTLLYSDLTEGRRRLERALSGLEASALSLGGGPERLRLEAAAYSALADNAVYAGNQPEARAWLARLRPLMTALPPAERSGALEAVIEVALRDGDLSGFAAALEEAEQLLPHSATFEAYRAQLHWYRGEFAEAGAVFGSLIERQPEVARSLTLENDLGMVCWARGRLAEAATWLERSLTTWRGVQHTEALSRSNLGLIRASQGRWAEALTLLDEAEILTRQIGSQTFLADVYYRRGLIHARAGRVHSAAPLYAEALTLMARVGDPFRLSYIHAALTEACVQRGEEAQAAAHLSAAHTLARQVGHPIALALAERAGVLLAQATGDCVEARRAGRALTELTRTHDMREHLGYALVAVQAACAGEDSGPLEEARQLGEEIGAPELIWRAGSALLCLKPDDHTKAQAGAAYALLVQAAPVRWFGTANRETDLNSALLGFNSGGARR